MAIADRDYQRDDALPERRFVPNDDVRRRWIATRGYAFLGAIAAVCILGGAVAELARRTGLALVERVAHPSVGICIDSWNVWQSRNLDELIRQCGRRILVVQLSDWRRPRSTADRYTLGDGEIPLASIMREVRRTGYEGPWVVEILSSMHVEGSLWKRMRRSKSKPSALAAFRAAPSSRRSSDASPIRSGIVCTKSPQTYQCVTPFRFHFRYRCVSGRLPPPHPPAQALQ